MGVGALHPQIQYRPFLAGCLQFFPLQWSAFLFPPAQIFPLQFFAQMQNILDKLLHLPCQSWVLHHALPGKAHLLLPFFVKHCLSRLFFAPSHLQAHLAASFKQSDQLPIDLIQLLPALFQRHFFHVSSFLSIATPNPILTSGWSGRSSLPL